MTNKHAAPANVRLVLAAPKMLEALTLAVEYAETHPEAYTDKNGFGARWIIEARAAIAKANGN